MKRHLYLIGYRATGKSTVGRAVAETLGFPFVDLDREIVRADGREIATLFAEVGESGFRALETAALARAADREETRVVATGGGAVLEEKNCRRLQATGRIVWLTAPESVLMARMAGDPRTGASRPALTDGGDPLREVHEILEVRRPLYRAVADLELETEGVSVADLCARICTWWRDGEIST